MLIRLFGLVGCLASLCGAYFSLLGERYVAWTCLLIGVLACAGARFVYDRRI